MAYRKKLIEVALPLEAINMESAREKSIRHGHPSTLHLWWAGRPLAACRAVLWASLVDDPSSWPEKFPTVAEQEAERQRLFDILGRIETEMDKKGNTEQVVRGLVSWDEINDPKSGVLERAQAEIARCLAWERGEDPPEDPAAVRDYIAKYAPPAYDPFAGRGSIPLEAQRLGLEAHASDLNPVAVLINKALIEIPPKFKDQYPVNGADRAKKNISSWRGAQGLAADVRYYGAWMRDRAFEQIGHLYPKVTLPTEQGGGEATVIAWLWARTVTCPNPACGCSMPLVRSFQLSTKKGKEAWVEPGVVRQDGQPPQIQFVVQSGEGTPPEGTVERKGARCVACETPVPLKYVQSEGRTGRMGAQLMAIVAEGQSGRTYLRPTADQEAVDNLAEPTWKPETDLSTHSQYMAAPRYGMTKHADLFTNRQLVALTTLSNLVAEAKEQAIVDAVAAGLPNDDQPLSEGGTGARAYGEAIATCLGLAVSRLTDICNALCRWEISKTQVRNLFGRQAIPMIWDFAENNVFANAAGDFAVSLSSLLKVIERLTNSTRGLVLQHNATADHAHDRTPKLISTDPPYYDAVPYADLSDFFYVWLRYSIGSIYPNIFGTLLVPKTEEMVADRFRHGSKEKAKVFFEKSLIKVFHRANKLNHHNYPLTVYYALKQTETDDQDQVASTGWETILEGLMQANFSIGGTWPLRTELSNRMRGQGSNALASSIVLVCRPRPADAPKTTRRQFLSELKRALPKALHDLQQGNIAPVDLAQASIGPGMAVYSQYAAVLENDGSPLRVRTALQLINQLLDEFLAEQEGEFDGDTRWALTWFEQYQFNEGPYGEAETLSKARNVSVQGLVESGILQAKAGKVNLLKRTDLPKDWNPAQDDRTPDWEATQHLIQCLDQRGELATAALLAQLGDRADRARDLAYRLYSLCDKKGWTQEAIAYNSLVIAWPELQRLARSLPDSDGQLGLEI